MSGTESVIARSGKVRSGAYAALNGLYWMLACVALSFAGVFLQGRGCSDSEIGVIVAAGYCIGLVIQPLTAAAADRSPRAPIAVICLMAAASGLVMGLLLAMPGRGLAVTAAFAVFLALAIALQPLVNAFAFYLERLGTPVPFGLCRGMGSLAYGVLAAVLGLLARRAGADTVLMAGIAVIVLMLALMTWFTRAGTPRPAEKEQDGAARAENGLKSRSFACLLVSTALLYLSHAFLTTFTIQIVQGVGGDSADMGALTAYLAVLELPAMLLFERLLRRFSCGGLLKFAAVFFAVKNLAVLAAGSLPGLYGAMSFQALAFALFVPASVRYAGMLAGEDSANRAQAAVTAMISLGNIAASAMGGFLMDGLGLKAAIAAAASSAVAGAAVMWLGLKKGS